MMNHKMVNSSLSAKRLKQRNKSAVLHNGSFITEAFPVKGREVYEEVEGGSMDSCLQYPVYNDSNVVVVSSDDIAQDHHLDLQGAVIEANELTSVDQLFSICTDTDKSSQHHAVHVDGISKVVVVEDLPYNTDTSMVSDTVQLSEVSSTLTANDSCYSNCTPNKSSDKSSSMDIGDNQIDMSNSNSTTYPKVVGSSNASSPVCIISSSHNLWHKPIATAIPDTIVSSPKVVKQCDSNLRSSPTAIAGNPFKHCIVDCNNIPLPRTESNSQIDVVETCKSLSNNATHIEYVSDLPTTSNVETPKIYPDGPFHFINAVTTEDGAIELVDSNGRTFRIQSSEDTSNAASSLQPHTAAASEASTILEQTYYGESIPILDQSAIETPAQILQPQQDETVSAEQPDVETSQDCAESNLQQTEVAAESNRVKPSTKKSTGLIPVGRRRGGWPKGKKRKSDRFRIKAPKTAYLLFAKKRRKELMAENPNYSFSEATVIMGRDWTALDVKLKEEYTKLAEEDQARFSSELKEYQQTDEYKNLLKRKRDETSARLGGAMDEDLGYVEEEYTLFCHICNQRFSSRHNRKEHLAGRVHLKNLESELRKQQESPKTDAAKEANKDNEKTSSKEKCCQHCVNRAVGSTIDSESMDISLDINSHMETFLYRHSQRELEVQMLRENLKSLKETNSQLSKDLITIQEAVVKAKQEIQSNKQWQMQLAASIDNLKMVPTLFGVINF